MTTAPKRVGILTGGGDCPGLNAVIRAVAKGLLRERIEVVGVLDGFLGLIEGRTRGLDYEAVSNILTRGGTVLGSSNKADPSRYAVGQDERGAPVFEDVTDRCFETIERDAVEAVVVVGGDGTMTCAQPFVRRGLPVIGVPKTIDNDIVGTEMTFGFASAVETAADALDKVQTTAASHHRAIVVELMGRNAGWLTLHAGIAGGADAILIPEIPFRTERVCEFVSRRNTFKRRFTVIAVSEGAAPVGGAKIVARRDPTSPDPIRLGGVAQWLSGVVEDRTGIESRHVVLGHVQRGGSPAPADRVLGTLFGRRAVELVLDGAGGRMVAMRRGEVTDIDIAEPAGRQRLVPVDHALINAARSVYTSFGDEQHTGPAA